MGYYNPQNNPLLQQLQRLQNGQNNMNPFVQPGRQMPQINENDFFALTSTLDKQSLQRLVAQARSCGISEADIKTGLELLLNH